MCRLLRQPLLYVLILGATLSQAVDLRSAES